MANNAQNNHSLSSVSPNSGLNSDYKLSTNQHSNSLITSTSASRTNAHSHSAALSIKEMFVTRSLERILAEKESKKTTYAALRKASERALGTVYRLY